MSFEEEFYSRLSVSKMVILFSLELHFLYRLYGFLRYYLQVFIKSAKEDFYVMYWSLLKEEIGVVH